MKSTRFGRVATAMSLVAAATLVLAGCSGGSSASNDKAGSGDEALTVGVGVPPLSLDPAKAGRGTGFTAYLTPAYEPLVRTEADGKIVPALAIKWEFNSDNTQLKFTLRDDAKFSDGEKVTGDAVAKSILYWKDTNGPFANQLANLKSAEGDGQTVTLTTTTPFPNLISLFNADWLAGDIIAPKGLETPNNLLKDTYGAGPYVLDTANTVTGSKYVYTPNKYYYDKSAQKFTSITVSVYSDPNSAIQAVKSGQIDLFASDSITANTNKASLTGNIKVALNDNTWSGLVFVDRTGTVDPFMKDVRVRQAVNYALDRKVLAKALFGDYGKPYDQLQTQGFLGYDKSIDNYYSYNPTKAKELLKEAGYPNGLTIKNIQAQGTVNTTLAQAMAQQLEKVGITLKTTETSTYNELTAKVNQGGYDSMMYSGSGNNPALNASSLFANGDGGYNPLDQHDPELDALIADAQKASGDEAQTAWAKVYKWVVENAWWAVATLSADAYIYNGTAVQITSPAATNIVDLATLQPAK